MIVDAFYRLVRYYTMAWHDQQTLMHLSIDKRYEIVFLHTHDKGPQLGSSAIAKYVHCDKKTVLYWINRWNYNKDLSDQPKSGRKRITTPKEDNKIVELAKKKDDITADEIKQEMKKRKIEISRDTIRRRLHESEGKYMAKLSKPLLGEAHKEKRLQWAKVHTNFDWNKVIFSDESTFCLNQRVKKTWQFPGKRKLIRSVKHPMKVHVWGCFSASGFGKIFCFVQNLNAKFMITVYEKGLLPSVEKLFGADNTWILQEDNDPKHRSKLVGKWKEENDVRVLPWPAMSPDQNPIENVWGLMKINLSKKKINTVRGLKGELVKEWNRLPDDLAGRLVSSMKNRVTILIEANGDYTMY
jgi:transposase